MDNKWCEALASCIYVNGMQLAGRAIVTDDQRIRASGLYLQWEPGEYAAGVIRNAGGQTWQCYQAHDTGTHPDIVPGNSAWFTFWRPLHGKTAATARPFTPPTGAHDMYLAGECMVWTDGTVMRCVRDTAYGPGEDAAAWEKAG